MIWHSNVIRLLDGDIELPIADNTTEALQIYRAANERFRQVRVAGAVPPDHASSDAWRRTRSFGYPQQNGSLSGHVATILDPE